MTLHLPGHPTLLHLIRHGEVEEMYHNVFGGSRIDMGLSPLGQRQAQALASATSEWPVDAVYASPMRRVRQTMQPLLDARQISPVIMEDLREMDFGDWTGHRWQEVHEKFGVSAYDWLQVLQDQGIPNGENAAAVQARTAPCLNHILASHPHQSIAIVCHGGIIRVLLSLLLDLPLCKMSHFNIDYAGITTVEIQPEKKHAVELNLLNWCPWMSAK